MDLSTLANQVRRFYAQGAAGGIRQLILKYDSLVERVSGGRRVQRAPLRILKNAPIWKHMLRMVEMAKRIGVDPLVWLSVQFETFARGTYPRPPMLYSENAVRRFLHWQVREVNKYRGNVQEMNRVQATNADDLVRMRSILDMAATQWKQMGSPNILDAAISMPAALPAPFYLAWPDVRKVVRSGRIPQLAEELAYLDANPELLAMVREWHGARQ